MEEEKKKSMQLISECVRLSTAKTESEKVTYTVGTFLDGDSIGSLFTRAVGYTVVSEFVQVVANQAGPEKVASTVATF